MGTRPCRGPSASIPVRTGLLVSCPVPSDPSVAIPPLAARRARSGFVTSAYRRTLRKGEPRPFGASASLGLRLSPAGSPRRQAESRSSKSYGRVVHLPLLPTPPHGDAVAFGYGFRPNPGEDLHLADTLHLQAHWGRPPACRLMTIIFCLMFLATNVQGRPEAQGFQGVS
jgi:hypothetical protein